MRFDRKIQVFLISLLALTLTGCKDGGEAAPTEYQVGEETIAALVPEEEGATVAQEEGPMVYTYEGLSAPGETAKAYLAQLTAEEFTVVDETYRKTDAPDFTTPEGTVQLAKDAAEEGRVLSVQLAWDEEGCTVTVDAPEGKVDTSQPQGMTLTEAEDYFRGLSPRVLGLDGASMEEYRVYALSGAVLVDRTPCLQMNVYCNENPEGTNDLKGMYLMTSDGRRIYRLSEAGGAVEELDLI